MFWMPPHRGAGQAPQVRHDGAGTFYDFIKICHLVFGYCDLIKERKYGPQVADPELVSGMLFLDQH